MFLLAELGRRNLCVPLECFTPFRLRFFYFRGCAGLGRKSWSRAIPGLAWLAALSNGGLPRRKQEVVYFLNATKRIRMNQQSATLPKEIFADIYMSMDWLRALEGKVPCLASTSMIWCLGRGRILSGPEVMAIQGFSFSDQKVFPDDFELDLRGGCFGECTCEEEEPLPQWSTEQLRNMAGNAFNGMVVVAILTAGLSSVPWLCFPPDLDDGAFGDDSSSGDSAAEENGKEGGETFAADVQDTALNSDEEL